MIRVMNASCERQVGSIADGQHGVVTRRQALAVGMTDRMIERRVSSGVWGRLAPGVYRLYGDQHSLVGRLAAATAFLPAVVSHESAAELHGLARVPHGRAVVTVPHRCTRRFPGVYVHQSTDLTEDFVVAVSGLPTTSISRTIVDLAAVLHPQRLRRVVDECLVTKVVGLETLVETLATLSRRGKPGVQRLREILESIGPGMEAAESVLEAELVRLLVGSGLPEPMQQLPLPWREGRPGRIDLAYPEAHLLIEADSRRWHSMAEAFEVDRRRDNLAMLAGWRVLRFTWRDVVKRPDYVVRLVAELLDTASPPVR